MESENLQKKLAFGDYLKQRSGTMFLILPRWVFIILFTGNATNSLSKKQVSPEIWFVVILLNVFVSTLFLYAIYDIKGKYSINPSFKKPSFIKTALKITVYSFIILAIIYFTV